MVVKALCIFSPHFWKADIFKWWGVHLAAVLCFKHAPYSMLDFSFFYLGPLCIFWIIQAPKDRKQPSRTNNKSNNRGIQSEINCSFCVVCYYYYSKYLLFVFFLLWPLDGSIKRIQKVDSKVDTLVDISMPQRFKVMNLKCIKCYVV